MAGVLRPSFELECALAPERIVELVHRRLLQPQSSVCGITADERIELHVPSSRQHLWSPQLVIDLYPEGEHTSVTGRFGPHPHVWVLCVAIMAATGFGCLVGASFGFAQLATGQAPTGLWSFPAAAAVMLALYLVSLAGRSLGAQQMGELRAFFEKAVGEAASAQPMSSRSVRAMRRAAVADF